jgi:hypothetical protein
MLEAAKQVVKARSESHSDIADTPAAREYQASLTERRFGEALLRRLRETKGELRLQNLREEWLSTEDGLVYEISADAQQVEQ